MASPLPLQLLLQLRIEGEVDLTEEDGQEESVPGGGRGETQNTKQTFQCHTCDDNINVQILVQYPNTFDLSDDVLKRSYRLDYD